MEKVNDSYMEISYDSLKIYYDQLSTEDIAESVELLKVAEPLVRLELIGTDCLKYISIISNYKDENLQNLCNVIVHRIGEHLHIKFRLNSRDKWEEVGFFDKDNSDTETLNELQRVLTVYVTHIDKFISNNLSQVASGLNGDVSMPYKYGYVEESTNSPIKQPEITFTDPSLQPTPEQLKSAGYEKPPSKEAQSRTNITSDACKDAVIQDKTESSKMSPNIAGNLLVKLSDMILELKNSPLYRHPVICDEINNILSKQPTSVLAEMFISLIDT